MTPPKADAGYRRPSREQLQAMTPVQLGESFVAMIKAGGRSQADRELVRDALLDGVIQHPVVAKVIKEADYAEGLIVGTPARPSE